jgi:cell pole-organizing protein PopZ
MSDTNAQEPTMEEILASIRRIISEDDTPAAAAPVAEAPAPIPMPEPPHAETAHTVATPTGPEHASFEDDVLELTEPLDPPATHLPPPPAPEPHHATQAPRLEETLGDLDVYSRPAHSDEPLVGVLTAESSASHFGALARSVTLPKEGRSLEDLVREMLKPMLREWLDRNLTTIVEARVQAEVERIARRHDY